MTDERWLGSLDAWKTDAPAMPSVEDRQVDLCVDCDAAVDPEAECENCGSVGHIDCDECSGEGRIEVCYGGNPDRTGWEYCTCAIGRHVRFEYKLNRR